MINRAQTWSPARDVAKQRSNERRTKKLEARIEVLAQRAGDPMAARELSNLAGRLANLHEQGQDKFEN